MWGAVHKKTKANLKAYADMMSFMAKITIFNSLNPYSVSFARFTPSHFKCIWNKWSKLIGYSCFCFWGTGEKEVQQSGSCRVRSVFFCTGLSILCSCVCVCVCFLFFFLPLYKLTHSGQVQLWEPTTWRGSIVISSWSCHTNSAKDVHCNV